MNLPRLSHNRREAIRKPVSSLAQVTESAVIKSDIKLNFLFNNQNFKEGINLKGHITLNTPIPTVRT